jgi:trehalose 6-phosphate phosphatase
MIWDRPVALFLDVDGTLLDIGPSPSEVQVPRELVTVLESARAGLDGAVALISGRPIADLDRLFAPLRIAAAGQHGIELRLAPEGAVDAMPASPPDAGLRRAVRELAASHPGVRVEDKGRSLAVHYRDAPSCGEALSRALEGLLARSPGWLALRRGKMVLELRDRRFSKASAVEEFLRHPPFAGRLPVFVGDDVTDEDGFAAVERHGGIAMPVGEISSGFAGAAPAGERRSTFAGPADVRSWLATFAPVPMSGAPLFRAPMSRAPMSKAG